ncbi:MAG: DUF1566 domain-containing protein [Chrysiogenia bacterium]
MEDEYQSTLRKKISILFQLGKWPDVVKLCESYSEKYGKDMELDLMRFKSERHLGISASPQKSQDQEIKKAAITEKDQPLVLLDDEVAVDDDSVVFPVSPLEEKQTAADLEVPASPAEEMPFLREDKIAYDPSDDDSDLIITDPFEENEPGFSLAADEPPVILSDRDESESVEITGEPAAEIADAQEKQVESPVKEIEVDFDSMGSITLDADPQLTPDKSEEEPSAADFSDGGGKVWDDPDRSTSGGSEFLEEQPEEIPSARLAADEEPQYGRGTFHEISEKMPPIQKKAFPFKLLLLIALPLVAALLVWLVLSGKLNFSGSDAPAVDPQPVAKALVTKQPQVTKSIPPSPMVPAVVEKDKVFDEKLQLASALFKKGDLLKAWAVVLEAKKIKMTEPLRLLEEQLAARIQADEARAMQESQVVQNQWQQESQAFARAEAENTMAGWQNFLNTYPQGEFAFKAEKKIAAFKKQAQENVDQQLLLKIRQLQKTKLRSTYLSLGQADIAALLRQGAKPPAQFEAHEHGGAKVMLDFATGLMWNLWKKPMAYDKAKWWANRITAGYGGWRLPSSEEAVSLLLMDRTQYAGLEGFAVWSGDTVNDQSRSVWVLKLPEGQFAAGGYDQFFYVWAVRTALK